jgi:hypothetical protein
MRASSSWAHFYRMMNRTFPKKGKTIGLALGDRDGQPRLTWPNNRNKLTVSRVHSPMGRTGVPGSSSGQAVGSDPGGLSHSQSKSNEAAD